MNGSPSFVSMTWPDQRCVIVERGHRAPGGRLEPLEAAHGVLGLTGLVIVAAEDDEVVIRALVQAQVVVRTRGVPEQHVRHRALRDATGNDI